MIKPKYSKRTDLSQIARSIVEHATGEPLTPPRKDKDDKPNNKQSKGKNKHS